MSAAEFSRPFDVRQVEGRLVRLTADAAECEALARRFDLVRIDGLDAELQLSRDKEAVSATGTLHADIVQSCAISAEDLPVAVHADVSFRFVPARLASDAEVELDEDELDEIEYHGSSFDLGEAVAQSLALSIDPFATGPQADAARTLFKDEEASAFAALKDWKKGGS